MSITEGGRAEVVTGPEEPASRGGPGGQPVLVVGVVRGHAADALLEAGRGAELLVLGNHGRGALTGALLGSVAQRCVQHTPCPLVLVPAPEPPPGALGR